MAAAATIARPKADRPQAAAAEPVLPTQARAERANVQAVLERRKARPAPPQPREAAAPKPKVVSKPDKRPRVLDKVGRAILRVLMDAGLLQRR